MEQKSHPEISYTNASVSTCVELKFPLLYLEDETQDVAVIRYSGKRIMKSSKEEILF